MPGHAPLYALAILALSLGVPRDSAAQDDRPQRPVRVVVVEAAQPEALDGPWTRRLAGLDGCRAERLAPAEFHAASLDKIDVVVVVADTLPPAESLRALGAAVSRGLGLVVGGAAVDLARSEPTLAALIEALPVEVGGEEAARHDEGLLVAVDDQSHPITQCLTSFRHLGAAGPGKLRGTARRLASAVSGEEEGSEAIRRPLVWASERRAGRVAVTVLDVTRGPSTGAAVTVLRRAVEWSARRPVSEVLDGPVVLAPRAFESRGYYLGRRIAGVMSYRGADWLTRSGREEEERPEDVLDALGLRPGQTVADLGAGNGYFTLRMARRVGPAGRVLAVDIQQEMLALLESRAQAAGIDNIELLLAEADDPKLPRGRVDLVLMVDVYHELSAPQKVMAEVRRSLAPKGRVVLVEYRGEDPLVPIKPLHRMTLAQVRVEMEALSLRVSAVHEFLPHQRIIICTADEDPAESVPSPRQR